MTLRSLSILLSVILAALGINLWFVLRFDLAEPLDLAWLEQNCPRRAEGRAPAWLVDHEGLDVAYVSDTVWAARPFPTQAL